jgi:chromate transporter
MDDQASQHPTVHGSLGEVFLAFAKLGLTSFGGPIAHLGFFRAEFVERRKWLSESDFADLVALCQFLPGPASSQVVFALGFQRAGILGSMTASLCFTLPSAALMIAFAYGVVGAGDLAHAGWLQGLKVAAVAVVAQAVWSMGKTLCPDPPRVALCMVAAVVLVLFPAAFAQVGVILLGGVVGYLLYRKAVPTNVIEPPAKIRGHRIAAAVLAVWVALLLILPGLVAATQVRHLAWFDSCYRAGSLVFGGGHVVLPLLQQEIVPRGWLSDDLFLAGYAAAQAVPGPLFTFSAYLGAAMQPGPYAWLNGLWCLLAIFLPAWLLIGGTLPFWHSLRGKRWAQAGLRGANAAVVGVLLAALYNPVGTEGIRSWKDLAAAVVGFVLLQVFKCPSWLVVLGAAAMGQWLL